MGYVVRREIIHEVPVRRHENHVQPMHGEMNRKTLDHAREHSGIHSTVCGKFAMEGKRCDQSKCSMRQASDGNLTLAGQGSNLETSAPP